MVFLYKLVARSRWKLTYFSKNIWRLIFKRKHKYSPLHKKLSLTIYSRGSSIPQCFSGFYVNIHKGKNYRQLLLDVFHSHYKFGEYGYTRKLYYYPLKKKKRR